MAAEVARRLLEAGDIDLVLCFAPSCQVVDGLANTFHDVLERRFDGRLGSVGMAVTYQGMEYQDASFWKLLDEYRVLAVFDEIHHCAGHDPLLSNSWGQIILQRIQDQAAYTLALSGTPWRSDEKAIVLARYSNPEGRLICDYRYGLKEAIADGVCRSPRIVLIDNHSVRLTEQLDSNPTVTIYPSIAQLLNESPVSFEDLLSHDEIMLQLIEQGCRRLDDVRSRTPNAAGLVVTTSVRHANQVATVLRARGEICQVVTNQTPGAQNLINEFRHGTARWIVAVGMISEGTDIPRLQVCCYLSRIRTELHYRQVLGRILRHLGNGDDHAWLYVLAESALQQFSQRVANDLPEDLAVIEHVHSVSVTPDIGVNGAGDGEHLPETPVEISLSRSPRGTADAELDFSAWDDERGYRVDMTSSFRSEILAIY